MVRSLPPNPQPMDRMTLQPNETLICPHCHAEQGDPAKDFIVPNRVGIASRADDVCVECDRDFSCETLPSGEIEVEKL